MPNFQIQFDRISFFLGFLAATLFWWVVARIRPLLPLWRQQIRQYLQVLSQRNFSSVEAYLRREIVRTAQRQHIAAGLFSLDEILIQPRLLTPPGGQDPDADDSFQPIANRLIPYLPDWPEISAPYGVDTLLPHQALLSGRHLIIIGHPGSGKTVTLAHLASLLARRDAEVSTYAAALPLYTHILDLDTTIEENRGPLENLYKAVSSGASVVMQPQIPRFLRTVFRDKNRRVVLLLDGLDELPVERFQTAVKFLEVLLKQNPNIQAVVTASPDYFDGLTKIGFYPVPVAGLSQRQRIELAQKWGRLWYEQIIPEAEKQAPGPQIDPQLMDNWLSSENAYTNPLEWTMRIWGAYAGDLSGANMLNVLDTHISRYLPSPALMPVLEDMAFWMMRMPAASLPYSDLEKFLSSARVTMPAPENFEIQPAEAETTEQASAQEPEEPQADHQPRTRSNPRRKKISTQGEDIITALLRGGVLVEHANHQIRFASPIFYGFLAGMKIQHEDAAEIINAMEWPVHAAALHFAAVCDDAPEWIYTLIENSDPPLYRGLMQAARWLRDGQPSAQWRSHIMRTLVTYLQNETVPPGMRMRMVAAFYLSEDPMTGKLFKQLLGSPSPIVRKAALLGLGALGSQQHINDILDMLADTDPDVRYCACAALAAIPGETALNAVVDVMLTGDEEIRQAAAEALALNPVEGRNVLEEAAGVEDLLTRRAAVFGLLQIGDSWAQKVLEKIAVEDGQWVVRNAAAQALETLQKRSAIIPNPMPEPSESPWLLAFASKLGMGILPGEPATDVLLTALKSGSVEEQIAALHYLREQPEEGVVGAVYQLLYSDQTHIVEPALQALWWMSATGARLPSPVMFGLS